MTLARFANGSSFNFQCDLVTGDKNAIFHVSWTSKAGWEDISVFDPLKNGLDALGAAELGLFFPRASDAIDFLLQ
jgi:hypothetical protein